jgi:PUA domain protein
MMPRVTVDRGAIKFVLKGADVMCPGLTSAGGDVSVDLPPLAPVAIWAEGKAHALAVGSTRLSTKDIRAINKGVGIEAVHFCGDQLWTTPPFE